MSLLASHLNKFLNLCLTVTYYTQYNTIFSLFVSIFLVLLTVNNNKWFVINSSLFQFVLHIDFIINLSL